LTPSNKGFSEEVFSTKPIANSFGVKIIFNNLNEILLVLLDRVAIAIGLSFDHFDQ
jgi:hypothetical protein